MKPSKYSIQKKTEHQFLNPSGNVVFYIDDNGERQRVASLGWHDFIYRFSQWVKYCQKMSWFPDSYDPEVILHGIGQTGSFFCDWQIVTVVTEVFRDNPEDLLKILKQNQQ